jgi:hypothetical protein
LHCPRTSTHEHLELVGAGAVLLGEPAQHLDIAAAQQLVLSASRRPGRARDTTPATSAV